MLDPVTQRTFAFCEQAANTVDNLTGEVHSLATESRSKNSNSVRNEIHVANLSANTMVEQLQAAQFDLFEYKEKAKAQMEEMERSALVRDLARKDAFDELERTARDRDLARKDSLNELERTARDRDLARQKASEDAADRLANIESRAQERESI